MVRLDPPPGVFLRKNVILWELRVRDAQECDSKGFIGLAWVIGERRRDLRRSGWGYHKAW